MINEITPINAFPTSSKVWIYQANQPIDANNLDKANEMATAFAKSWESHGRGLKATATILHNRFLFIMVDESVTGASGCSIDSSVEFVRQLGMAINRDFFDRMIFSYKKDGVIHTVNREQFVALYQNGDINDDTIVFDTLVNSKGDFDGGFEKRLGDSWHARMV